jgi:hypothetical protein
MVTKKKLTPASIVSQKKWSSLPITKKNSLRKMLPDKDKDGVPNKFDCRPKNKRKQEAFLSSDMAFINAHGKDIVLDKRLGDGTCGEVFTVKGNDNLVVKVPNRFMPETPSSGFLSPHYYYTSECKLQEEIRRCKEEDITNEPLLIPTKVMKIKRGDKEGSTTYGLVRPRVTPITVVAKPYQGTITMSQIESIRRKIIELSYKGFVFNDGIQMGIDRVGRPLIYDLGLIQYCSPGDDYAFTVNDREWLEFLQDIDKWNGKSQSQLARLGRITKRANR